MAGDLICWRKNNASEGLVNSYIAYIVSIKPGEMVINDEFKLNRTINLNEEKFTHFDHAYGATVHRVQGLDSTLVLGHSQSCVADEDQQKFYHPINNLNSFLVMASRGDYFDFFVDDKKKYMQAILQNCNVKLSALEISMGDEWDKLNCAFKEKIKQVTGLHDVPVTEDPVAIKAAPTAEIVLLKQELQREFKRSPARPPATRYDVEMIKQRLNQDVVSFVASYLGSPILRNNKMAMWALGNNKKKANLSVEISGYKIGYWCDHRIPTGGKDLISFYTHFNKVDYKTALKELSNEYGINKQLNIHTTSVKTSLQSDLEEQTKKINQANKTYQNSSSTKGTLAEKYLREQRGIQGELPNDFRFHPSLYHYIEEKNFPALIIPARDQQGKIIALNRIFLNSDGSKIAGFAKLTQGVAKNATIDINLGGKLGKTYISEGTENALTIKDAKPEYDIKACLSIGNLGGICFRPGTHTVVIVADNDLNNPSTKQALIKAVASFQNQGLNVELALPKSIDIKLDLNDVYKSSGLAATLKILDNTVKVSNITQLGDKYEPLQTSFTRIEKDSLNLNHRQIEHER